MIDVVLAFTRTVARLTVRLKPNNTNGVASPLQSQRRRRPNEEDDSDQLVRRDRGVRDCGHRRADSGTADDVDAAEYGEQ